jgi:integrase
MSQLAKVKNEAPLVVTIPTDEQVLAYALGSKAVRTREAYKKQWSYFEEWCELRDLASLPAEAETLARYITALADEGLPLRCKQRREPPGWRPSSIRQALAAIRSVHESHGLHAANGHPLVCATLEGIERKLGIRPERKAPVLPQLMHAMVEVLPDTLSGARDRALILVGFLGAFRRSELVAFNVSDFRFGHDGITVFLRRSKTDQRGVGRDVGLPKNKKGDPSVCPVNAMRGWLERSGITDGLIFRSVDRHGNLGASLGDRDVARIVKRTALAAGVALEDVANLAAHSLRAGLATTAAKADKSVPTIMRQTGHGSIEMVMRYVREADLFTDNAADGLL